jgi:hypothetical protein
LQDETDLPQPISVCTQTDFADSLTAAMIDSAHAADAPADEQTEGDDDCKQPADTNRLQRITIELDHANAYLAVSVITSL